MYIYICIYMYRDTLCKPTKNLSNQYRCCIGLLLQIIHGMWLKLATKTTRQDSEIRPEA